MAATGFLLERRRLALWHTRRDRCFIGAQIAEQRVSIREPSLDQAPADWHGRHGHGSGRRCNDRSRRDHRRDTVAIYAEARAAIHWMTPAEAGTPAPPPIVADEVGPIAEVGATIEAGVETIAHVAEVGVVGDAAAVPGRGIRWRERGEAQSRSRDREKRRT